jgi:hypothetical protein
MIGSMQHIRPYKIFTLIEASPTERLLSLPIPSRRGTGGTSLLETFLILAGMRVVEARRIFEFGTFLVATRRSLLSIWMSITPRPRIRLPPMRR